MSDRIPVDYLGMVGGGDGGDQFEGAVCREFAWEDSAALWLQPERGLFDRTQQELNYRAAKMCLRCPVKALCEQYFSRTAGKHTINARNAIEYYERRGVYRTNKGGRPRIERFCPVDQNPLDMNKRTYCSDLCKEKAKRARRNEQEKQRRDEATTVHLDCATCGQRFSRSEHLTAVTCSQACANRLVASRKAGAA